MARITKGDREEAGKYIRDSLTRRRQELMASCETERREAAEEAAREIEEEYQVEFTFTRVAELRRKADALEAELCKAVGESRAYYVSTRRDTLVEQRTREILAETEAGREIQDLDEQINDVSRRVFLATTHEDLAALVQELS